MKNKLLIASFLGSMILSSVVFSNAVADELTWLNTHDFIAGENVTLSHSAPYYPGSIAVTPMPSGEPDTTAPVEPVTDEIIAGDVEQVAEEIITGDGILMRFKVRDNYKLNSISLCMRNFESAPPFAINIYKLGVPPEILPEPGTGDPVMDDVLLGSSEPLEHAEFPCTEILLQESIQATGETLLLNVSFDYAPPSDPAAVAVISAIGLGEESTQLVIEDCDTGVPNIDINGISLSNSIDECAQGAKNHGKFVSCVTKIANTLKKEGAISGREKGNITKCAAKSSLP